MDISGIAKALGPKYAPRNSNDGLHRQRNNYLSNSIIPEDIFVYSGNGASLQTSKGELIDLSSMTVNCILGQNDPWVNANLTAYIASGQPSFLTTRLGGDIYYKVARRILDTVGRPSDVINHRQSNGTDVIELAILAAFHQRRPGQRCLVSFKGSYHGQGLTAYLASQLQVQHRFLIDESPVIFLDQPSDATDPLAVTKLPAADCRTLESLRGIGKQAFAVIIEPIQVNNSVNTPSLAFMQGLREICDELQIPLIFDEVQTGGGWLGTMSAAELYGVRPEFLALSKALTAGNGPLAALISDRRYQAIPMGTAAKTSGADIRSLVAADAVIDRLFGITDDSLLEAVPAPLADELKSGLLVGFDLKVDDLRHCLEQVQAEFQGLVSDIKGSGLIRGLQLRSGADTSAERRAESIQRELLDNGVLVRHSKDTLIIKPPIVLQAVQLERAFDIINKVFRRHQ